MVSIGLRKVRASDLSGDMGAVTMLAAFYGLEMAAALKWSVEQRYFEMSKAQIMISSGKSIMVLATNMQGMPLGMIMYTPTDDRLIRRIDALYVGEQFRGNGISTKLLKAIKDDNEFHTYATPNSVGWYQRNGFRVLRNHPEGTVEMTTAVGEPEYKYSMGVPIPTHLDMELISQLKALEKNIKQ